MRFGSKSYRYVHVTNLGHLVFYSPYGVDGWDSQRNMQTTYAQTALKIAPWWGMVTGSTAFGGPTTTYGEVTFEGRRALCATWSGLGHVLNTCGSQTQINWNETNNFQVLLVDRSDAGYEDFDIVFNYGSIQWDFSDGTGTCVGGPGAGYSMDIGSSGELVAGSWTYGAFLDSNPTGLVHRTLNSTQPGRLVYQIRNGATTPSIDTGGTFGPNGPTWGENPTGNSPDPVNTATGSFHTSATDLSLAGIGVPFELARTYNSADSTSGPLGPGWTHSLNASLIVQPNGDVLARSEQGQQLTFVSNGNGTFTAPAFARSTLTSVGGGYELVTFDQLHYVFDAQGRLTSKRDRNGQGLALTSNPDGTLATVVGSGNRTITFFYAGGKLSRVALSDGRDVSYVYDGSGRLSTVTDVREGTSTYTYDLGGRLDTIVDQKQHTVVDNDYGADGRVITQRDARGNPSTFAWDPVTQTATYTDPRQNQWKDVYRSNVLVEQVDPFGNRTLYRYDPQLNLTDVLAPGRPPVRMTYDARGNLLTRDPGDQNAFPETFTYNALNDILTYRDGRANTTSYEYDTPGNLKKMTRPGATVTQYGRDPAGTGLLTSTTDPRAKTTVYGHDAQGNLESITTPLGNKTTMTYDVSGRMRTLVEPRGNLQGGNPSEYTTTLTYDDADHVLSVKDPLNNTTTYTYDPAGNVETVKDANTRETRYGYDEQNHLTSVTAPDLLQTTYGYDPSGNLTSRLDAKTHATQYEYDAANRLSAMTTAGGRRWTYGYDSASRRTQMVDANGNATPTVGDGTTTYGYDGLDRLKSVGYSDGTPPATFTYDGNGNRTTMTDVAGTESYNYDSLDRLTTISRPSGGFSYGYDPTGNVTFRSNPAASASYAFDDDGRLQSVTSSQLTTAFAYDAAANLTRTTLPSGNGFVETRSYDRAGRLVGVKNQKGSTTPLSEFTVTPDPVGNPLTIVGPTSGVTTKYMYDTLDRLTEVCFQANPCTSGSSPFVRWTYDAVGNRTTEGRPSGSTTYNYDLDDRLTSAGSTTYTYDTNGNQTQAGNTTFAHDLPNRLKSTTSGNTTTTYLYDGDGKRLQASTGTNASKKTNFLWDPLMPVPQLALERDGSSNLLRQYLYGMGRISMTTSNGSVYYFHHDQLGSVRNLTSSAGAAQWTYEYEPFGKMRTETKNNSKAPINVLKFTGEYLDGTSLYHLRARQYDTATGRFLGPDPVMASMTDPHLAGYVYANDRPTFGGDPTGECFLVCGVVGAVAEAAIYSAEVAFTDKQFSWNGLVTAGATGFVEGASGGVASRFIRTAAKGYLVPRIARVAGEAAGGAAGGFAAAQVQSFATCGATAESTVWAAVVGSVSSSVGYGLIPQRGFEVRTVRGLVRDQPNTRRLWRGTAAVGTIALPAQLAQSNMERCGGAGGNGT